MASLVRGEGAVAFRLQSGVEGKEDGLRRQFQYPVFSPSGRYVAFAELLFKADDTISAAAKLNALAGYGTGALSRGTGGKVRRPLDPDTGGVTSGTRGIGRYAGAEALVYEVPTDPTEYGDEENSLPIFNSGHLPGAPFFLQFTPDERHLVALCATKEGQRPGTSLILLDWDRDEDNMHVTRQHAGRAAQLNGYTSSRHVHTLLEADQVFFSFTTSHRDNSTIVAHCRGPRSMIGSEADESESGQEGVWMLHANEEAKADDDTAEWVKISSDDAGPGDSAVQWRTPVCHCAGGGDSVLLVEDGWLVSRALSRSKRAPDGTPSTKRLKEVRGHVQFLVSPDSSKV